MTLLKRPGILINRITFSDWTTEKFTQAQVRVKQPVRARAPNTEGRDCSYLRDCPDSHTQVLSFNQKMWKGFKVEKLKFSSAHFLLRDFCLLFTRVQEAKTTIYLFQVRCHCCQVDIIELNYSESRSLKTWKWIRKFIFLPEYPNMSFFSI